MSAAGAPDAGRPLAGLRVVEIGSVIAGPFAASLLADLGADVVKVEPPDGGDPLRRMGPEADGLRPWWATSARGKRCVAIDLKSPEGRARLDAFLARADVLVENTRPGVLERLGLGWPALRARHPRLVVLSISGFGQTGPAARRPGFGKIAEGMSGLVHLTGAPGERPLQVGFSLADASAGLFGTLGVAAALLARDADGRGARIDVALYGPLLRIVEAQFAIAARDGAAPVRRGRDDPYGWGAARPRTARIATLPVADGGWLVAHLPSDDALGAALRRAGAQAAVGDAALAALRAWSRSRQATRVRDALAPLGIEVAPVMDGAAIAAHPYFRARRDVLPAGADAPAGTWVPGFVGRPAADPGPRLRAPAVGADDGQADRAWADAVVDGRREGDATRGTGGGDPAVATSPAAPLAGLRVVELADTPGAAFAASLLADLGARVDVLEPAGGSGLERLGPPDAPGLVAAVAARRKHRRRIDPDLPRDAAALADALAGADLVVVDRGPGAVHPLLARAGTAPGAVVVDVHPTGVDRPQAWPWGTRPEFAAAASGMMALTGWPDGPPVQPEVPLADSLAGALAALRAVLALRARRRGDAHPRRIEVALHEAVQRMIEWQVPVATATGRAGSRSGNAFPLNAGIGNLHRARDGRWVSTSAANDAVARRLMRMVGGDALADDPRWSSAAARAAGLDALYARIDAWMAERTADEALAAAIEHDVVLGPVHDVDALLADPQVAARGDLEPFDDGGRTGSVAPAPAIRIER